MIGHEKGDLLITVTD